VALVGNNRDIRGIADQAERILLLSGTPIPNGRPIELYSLLSSLSSEAIGFRSQHEFGVSFCGARQVARREGRRTLHHWDYTGATLLKQLRAELFEKLMVRHLKKDVLEELGPKTRKIIFLDAPQKLKPLEKKILKKYSLKELMGERTEKGDIATYRREVGEAKVLQSFEYINQLIEDTGEKCVVFAHHRSVVDDLARLLSHHGALKIQGGMDKKERAAQAPLFQNEEKHRVIVCNLEAGGIGLTLTKAPLCVMVEPDWRPGINQQAEDRIHRMTQESNVYIHYLVLRGTLDERLLHMTLQKDENVKEVLG
jgi:SWI/SNF-related matrix-associated actin-dependent regulator 1 of chromatin subfamily A